MVASLLGCLVAGLLACLLACLRAKLFALLVLLCMLCLLCLACLVCFARFAGFALLGLLAWLAHFAWLAMSSLGLILLGRLARSGVLDFWLFLSKFYRKTVITCSKSEVEHDFLKTHVPDVIFKLVCQRSNLIRFLNP